MSDLDYKLLNTKIGKQLSGYLLIRNDLDFSSWCFSEAIKLPCTSDSAESNFFEEDISKTSDSLMRDSARNKISMQYGGLPNGNQTKRAALFEASLISYSRCFNRGLRTSLNKNSFTNKYEKSVHTWIMEARNEYVAHPKLRGERSIVGFRLVHDQNFGTRKSMVMSIISTKRTSPENETLAKLANHCKSLIDYVDTRLEEMSTASREQMLKMPADQINQLPSHKSAMIKITEKLDFPPFPTK